MTFVAPQPNKTELSVFEFKLSETSPGNSCDVHGQTQELHTAQFIQYCLKLGWGFGVGLTQLTNEKACCPQNFQSP